LYSYRPRIKNTAVLRALAVSKYSWNVFLLLTQTGEKTIVQVPAKQIDFTLILAKVKPMSGEYKRGRRLPHRRPPVTEVTNVHREVNNLIMQERKRNINRFESN
jgi:hypothetical protein